MSEARATIVHLKVFADPIWVDLNRLGVLPADIAHRARAGVHEMRPAVGRNKAVQADDFAIPAAALNAHGWQSLGSQPRAALANLSSSRGMSGPAG